MAVETQKQVFSDNYLSRLRVSGRFDNYARRVTHRAAHDHSCRPRPLHEHGALLAVLSGHTIDLDHQPIVDYVEHGPILVCRVHRSQQYRNICCSAIEVALSHVKVVQERRFHEFRRCSYSPPIRLQCTRLHWNV